MKWKVPCGWYPRQQGFRQESTVQATQIASLAASQHTAPSNPGMCLLTVSNQRRLSTGTGMKRSWRMPEER